MSPAKATRVPLKVYITICNEGDDKNEFLQAHQTLEGAIKVIGHQGFIAEYHLHSTGLAQVQYSYKWTKA